MNEVVILRCPQCGWETAPAVPGDSPWSYFSGLAERYQRHYLLNHMPKPIRVTTTVETAPVLDQVRSGRGSA